MAGSQRISFHDDVFIRQSSTDKPMARALAERLRYAGLKVWFDEWIIKPGNLIPVKSEARLEHSAVLLF